MCLFWMSMELHCLVIHDMRKYQYSVKLNALVKLWYWMTLLINVMEIISSDQTLMERSEMDITYDAHSWHYCFQDFVSKGVYIVYDIYKKKLILIQRGKNRITKTCGLSKSSTRLVYERYQNSLMLVVMLCESLGMIYFNAIFLQYIFSKGQRLKTVYVNMLG